MPATELTRRERHALSVFAVALALLSLWLLILPLLAPLVLAVLTAVIIEPVHGRIERRLGRQTLHSALASLLLVVVLAGAPVTGLTILLLAQARAVLGEIVSQEEATTRLAQFIQQAADFLARLSTTPMGRAFDLGERSRQAIREAGDALYHRIPEWFGHVGRLGVDLLILLVVLFFLLWKGRGLITLLVELIPTPQDHTRRILGRLEDTIKGVFLGGLITSLIQGVAGAAGFWLTGFQSFLVWGALVAAAGLIPFVGTGLVWVPALVYLLATGHPGAALGMLAVGAVVGTVDNLVRPLLIHERADVHPLLIFLSLVGGLRSVGSMGLVYGPLLAACLTEAVRIYRGEPRASSRDPRADE